MARQPDTLAASLPGPVAPDSLRHRPIRFVTVVLPCLNEEGAVGPTVEDAWCGLHLAGFDGEVLVVDNGSNDGSVAEAIAAGARVVTEPSPGYGLAHIAGILAARGDVIVMADADRTYDLLHLGDLLAPLARGADMSIASRLDNIESGAMKPLHRHLGTPAISWMIGLAGGLRVRDSQSGYRAFWRDQALDLNLSMPGMEYASEMLLRAGRAGWRTAEVPSVYRKRLGTSKLNTLSDGWRHLRFLLVMSPHVSLMLPGAVAAMLGLLLCLLSLIAPAGIPIGSYQWLPIFLGPTLLVLGAQVLCLGALAARRSSLAPVRVRQRLEFLERPGAINRLLLVFSLIALAGLLLDGALFVAWLAGASGYAAIGLAGLAQAAVIIGVGGVAATLGADFAEAGLGAQPPRS